MLVCANPAKPLRWTFASCTCDTCINDKRLITLKTPTSSYNLGAKLEKHTRLACDFGCKDYSCSLAEAPRASSDPKSEQGQANTFLQAAYLYGCALMSTHASIITQCCFLNQTCQTRSAVVHLVEVPLLIMVRESSD